MRARDSAGYCHEVRSAGGGAVFSGIRKRGADEDRAGDRALNSVNAMSPDPDALMAINASDCASDALFNNQALQRKSVRDESATLVALATTMAAGFNILITGHLQMRKPGAH